MTYDKTLKIGELVWKEVPYSGCASGGFVLEQINPRTGVNPVFVLRRVLDKKGKPLTQNQYHACDASFCQRLTQEYIDRLRDRNVERATEVASKTHERLTKFLQGGYVPKARKRMVTIHKLAKTKILWSECGVNVTRRRNYSEEWENVTCKNCFRRMRDSLTADSLISDWKWSPRVNKILRRLGVRTLREISQKTEDELLAYKNVGETCVMEIRRVLSYVGLDLAPGFVRVGS